MSTVDGSVANTDHGGKVCAPAFWLGVLHHAAGCLAQKRIVMNAMDRWRTPAMGEKIQ